MNLARVRFPGKHKKEEVIAVYHRHWFDILTNLFFPVLLFVVLITLSITLPSVAPELFSGEHEMFFAFLESSFYLFLWLYLFLVWIDVYFDVWIVTDERIVNIEQKDLFTRRVSELRFSRVQDVTSEVYVQTAGEHARFIFHNVPNPVMIKDLVMKLAQRRRREIGEKEA
jgi:hypothetical protein